MEHAHNIDTVIGHPKLGHMDAANAPRVVTNGAIGSRNARNKMT